MNSVPASVTPGKRLPDAAAAMRALLDSVRALTGDDAYERYLVRHQSTHPEAPALSPADFYTSEVERRYSGVARCC